MKGIIMMRFKNLLIIIAVLSAIIMFTGCQDEPTSVEQDVTAYQQGLSKFSLPDGATFVSATFYINVLDPASQNIDVHRITNPWEEMVVTWNNFGSSYAPGVEGSFNAAAAGWNSVDVTSLVGSWLDGTSANHGLLLAQDDQTYPRTRYSSRESIYQPYLEICYTENGGPLVCDTTRNIGDTYIYQVNPDENNGWKGIMYTGWGWSNDLEKQALIQFDLGFTPPPQVDCETAYAYGGGDVLAQCFIGLPGVNSNNWGWSNYIDDVSANFSFEWPIYAGAGGCDRSGAAIAGTLYVDYDASTDCVTIDYAINPPYALDDFHLWVSEDSLLPMRRNGRYVTAPGQFNHNGDTVVCNLDEPFWIAAHFGVCH